MQERNREQKVMKVVVAIDSFKGSLSSMEAGNAAGNGVLRVFPDAEITVRPLADGGEGTVEAMVQGMEGKIQTVTVTGPLGKPVSCRYGIIERTNTAVIEMSGAAGITLLTPAERNPLKTTTYGVGEVIRDAIEKGCRDFIIGIGGSATNDGGIGMLTALGYQFLNAEGKAVQGIGSDLADIVSIDSSRVIPELEQCHFHIACDVENPLYGPAGCSCVFAPQKGAGPDTVALMDGWMTRYADIVCAWNPKADPKYPGAGAAGGLGFAFLSFTQASLKPGVDIVLEETNLEKYLQGADFVITGEGQLDGQTVMGKAPVGVAKLAAAHHIPVFAFSGAVRPEARKCNEHGIQAFFPILRSVVSIEEAMDIGNASANMADAVEQVFRVVNLCDRTLTE